VVDLVRSQVISQLAAIRAGMAHPLGRTLIRAFGPPLQADPRQSACVLAGLGSWLHLDDTAYAGHVGNSTVAVPLAYAHARGLDGRELLTAVIAANECAARITAAATLGPLRGQAAAHTHLAGALAGRLRSECAPPHRWVAALGLAFTMPPWPVMRGFLGSDAKVLNAFTPVRMAMDAADAAAAGLTGAEDILEHPDGFLERFAAVPLPEVVTERLGDRWHSDTLSFKVRPAGPGVDAAVDCAIAIHEAIPGLSVDAVQDVCVQASLYTVLAGQRAAPYVTGPRSCPVGSLLLTVPYPVATALLTGDLSAGDLTPPAVTDPRRWELARKVRLVHDPELTGALIRSVAPFGEAVRQAGPRAEGWLHDLGGAPLAALAGAAGRPAAGYSTATKATGARVTVRLTDGRCVTRGREIPVGGIGPQTRATHAELVRTKLRRYGGSPAVAEACRALERLPAGELAGLLVEVLSDQHVVSTPSAGAG
jgi:2-methylcitrate dehydratase PrpD